AFAVGLFIVQRCRDRVAAVATTATAAAASTATATGAFACLALPGVLTGFRLFDAGCFGLGLRRHPWLVVPRCLCGSGIARGTGGRRGSGDDRAVGTPGPVGPGRLPFPPPGPVRLPPGGRLGR